MPLRQSDHDDLQDWSAGLHAAGASGASVRKVVTVLSGVLERAVRSKRLPASPTRGLELPTVRTGERKYLTAAQVEVMAEASVRRPPAAARARRRWPRSGWSC